MAGRVRGINLEFGPAVIACLAGGYLLFRWVYAPANSAEGAAHGDAALVLGGAVAGYVVSGYRGALTDRCMARISGASAKDFTDIKREDGFREGDFLAVTSLFAAAYVLFYDYAAIHFVRAGGDKGLPIPWPVALITATTLGALTFFSVRNAAYNRLGTLLEATMNLEKPRYFLVRHLRDAVFRDGHLYEPPGNIFVTVGITATFLGLAVGLVLLDLPSFFQANETPIGPEAQNSSPPLAALTSFTGCMGLALGVSMLGVLTSLAAQWLRGFGSGGTTEELLLRAEQFLAAKRVTTAPATPPEPSEAAVA